MAILITIIAFGLMISIHEFGHFIAAKRFGVLVHEFSIGMGPKLFSKKGKETTYSLRLLPIGGYVKLEGENEIETEAENDNPRAFVNLHPFKRIIILIAGAFMNILLGFILYIIININVGVIPSKVADVPAANPAQETVFQKGDEIVKLNNTHMNTFEDVSFYMSRYNKDRISVTLKRDGKVITYDNVKLHKTGSGYMLGVVFASEKASFGKSIEYAVYDTAFTAKAVIVSIGDLFTGRLSLDSMSGPVEIVSVVDTVASSKNRYTFITILELIAMITVNLGLFNLFPFPALDGGSIVFALYELITRRKIKSQVVGYASMIGFVLLMLLAVYVTAGDIKALINK